MRIRSFIIAYVFILAILLFADRRPGHAAPDRYSHVVDLTNGQNPSAQHFSVTESQTRIIAPGALIPGTWAAGQIPPDRLIAPLVVMDLNLAETGSSQISLDDIAAWEAQHGMIPQGSVVAIRRSDPSGKLSASDSAAPHTSDLPIARDAAQFLMEARYTIAFAVETPVDLSSDRTLARQLALHGNYVVEKSARFTALPATGSLIIVAPAKVAPAKDKKAGEAPVRILAMVR
jgi:kynurenine formamidase